MMPEAWGVEAISDDEEIIQPLNNDGSSESRLAMLEKREEGANKICAGEGGSRSSEPIRHGSNMKHSY